MTETPLIPSSLYGLRTWRWSADEAGERLRAACLPTPWPADGAWMHATCAGPGGHPAPAAGCACGVHAWHPRPSSARRVLASRFEVPGIVEAAGAIELQDDGFRAARARPYAFVLTPGGNAARVARLAQRYGARVVEVADARELVAWCREHRLGLDEATVDGLLGPGHARERRASRRRALRANALRVAAVGAIGATLLFLGHEFASGPPSPNGVYGRTGWVTLPKCPEPAPATPAGQPGC
ncbi:MAG: hypothetical protein HZB46_03115 [Solirubrobacterales bacterium]|nr:hypothetical protein [Solirubrobacterales bacterium]